MVVSKTWMVDTRVLAVTMDGCCVNGVEWLSSLKQPASLFDKCILQSVRLAARVLANFGLCYVAESPRRGCVAANLFLFSLPGTGSPSTPHPLPPGGFPSLFCILKGWCDMKRWLVGFVKLFGVFVFVVVILPWALTAALPVGIGTASGSPLYLLNGEPCVQSDYRDVCPYDLDPNLVAIGPILGPVPLDPNSWTILFGKFNREIFTCDPDGDPVDVELIATNCDGSAIQHDPNAGTWTLTCEVLPGFRWWHIRGTDRGDYIDPLTRDVVIVAMVENRVNHQPVLAQLQQRKLMHLMQKKLIQHRKRQERATHKSHPLNCPIMAAYLEQMYAGMRTCVHIGGV